ncbi:hypothetical protein F5884DRAFT_264231 [Xylogone sp. PMI_703]|nr:hypothetical protein F5884DRAFT_264231 [Xylogone sp. PMI_703]
MAPGAYFRAIKCHTCRKRKVKCGGERPSCLRCLRSGLTCTGYQRALDVRLASNCAPIPSNSNTVPPRRSDSESPQSYDSRVAHQPGHAIPTLDSSYIVVSPAAQHRKAFLSILQNIYLPTSITPLSGHNDGRALVPAVCSTWLYSACQLVSNADSNSLSNALLATALAIVAVDNNFKGLSPDHMIHNSMLLYARSLLSMRNRIAAPLEVGQHDWELLTLTCFACFSYELVINRSYTNVCQHLNGIGAILHRLGPNLLMSDLLQNLYFEYRAIDISFQMIHPQSTFLSRKAWIHPQWKTRHPKASHPLQRLLDEAYPFLPVYNKFSILYNNARASESVDLGDIAQLVQLLGKATSIKSTINGLYLAFRNKCTTVSKEGNTISDSQIFQTSFPQWTNEVADPYEPELGKVFPTAYNFADFSIATGFVFYEAVEICMVEFIEAMTRQTFSLTHDATEHAATDVTQLRRILRDHATQICQSAEYFLHSNKGIIGAMVYLFPLGVAKRTFLRLRNENAPLSDEMERKISWCTMIEGKLTGFRLSPYVLE